MPIGPAPRVVALAYHGVADIDETADPRRLVVSPRHLSAHVRTLKALGFWFDTAGGFVAAGGQARRPTAILTFDDGWSDAVTTVAPLLHGLGVRATFYVCSGLLGGQHPEVEGPAGRLLTADETRALAETDMEVGSHGLHHRDLRSLDDAELHAELADSRAALEETIGGAVRTLAYPYGFADDRVTCAARRAGYDLAWAWGPGPRSPMHQPRLPAPARNGAARLALKLAGLRRPAYPED